MIETKYLQTIKRGCTPHRMVNVNFIPENYKSSCWFKNKTNCSSVVGEGRAYVLTALPVLFISAVEDVVGREDSYCTDVLLKHFKLDIFCTKTVQCLECG